jgi:hypothetical protein
MGSKLTEIEPALNEKKSLTQIEKNVWGQREVMLNHYLRERSVNAKWTRNSHKIATSAGSSPGRPIVWGHTLGYQTERGQERELFRIREWQR